MCTVLILRLSISEVRDPVTHLQGFDVTDSHSLQIIYPALYNHISAGALPNSAERCDAPKCHPDTRVAIQDEILSWIRQRDDAVAHPERIKWVTGPAGTGKTAIMGSIADTCKDGGDLAAGFFFSSFSGSADRRSKRCFVATLAYQLQQHPALAPVRELILAAVAADPAVFKKGLEDQFEHLILGPLRHAKGCDAASYPKAIIIDGLDECEAEQ